MCNAIIIITIQLQLNGQLQSKRKQKETTNKIKTSPDNKQSFALDNNYWWAKHIKPVHALRNCSILILIKHNVRCNAILIKIILTVTVDYVTSCWNYMVQYIPFLTKW